MGLRAAARRCALKTASVLRLNDLALALQARRDAGPRIVVVEMHETLLAHADRLREHLDWVSNHFTLIDPATFGYAWERKAQTWPGSKPAVLFTFDDGRESNYHVAAPILESFGARGIFFIAPQFIGLRSKEAKNFYYSKIDIRNCGRPGMTDTAGATEEVWTPMTPQQLADLTRRGHWIGNHSFSHSRLAGLSASDLQREVRESREQIAAWTGKPVDAFAWAYSWDAIDTAAWQLIRETHRFCFTPCPGTVDLAGDSPHLIWRKEIESYYAPSEYQFMYSGLVDPIWSGKRKALKKMLGRQ
ncbi:MAG: polysaccharide deacetylase family protein [Terriglobales bacterium]